MSKIQESKTLLWEAGIDWVTLTAPGDDEHTAALGTLMGDRLSHAEEYGEALKPQGWSGFLGMGTKHLFFGRSKWGVMARASSTIATQVAQEVIKNGIQTRCTRIDFQGTIQAQTPQPGFAAAQREAIKRPSAKQKKARPREIVLYESADGGSGISVGDRRSARCGRIYDKTAEQRFKVAPRLWRYEAEFKQGQSRKFWNQLQEARDVEKFAVSAVVSYFNTVNIKEPWMLDIEPMRLPSTYHRTDNERRKEHLSRNVSSVVQALAAGGETEWLIEWFQEALRRGVNEGKARAAIREMERAHAEVDAIDLMLSK